MSTERPAAPAAARAGPPDADLVVVGAGLVGSAFALAAADAGRSTVLLGPREAPAVRPTAWDSRVYALSPGSQAWLAGLGVWERLDPRRMQPVYAMAVWGDRGPHRLCFDALEAGVESLACIAEAGALAAALADALAACPGIRRIDTGRPAALAVSPDAAGVVMDDGTQVSARLLVGADGANSWVRRALGIGTWGRGYPQRAVVANFACSRGHDATARQWFGEHGVLALLPLPGDHVSMVWSAPLELARELQHLPLEQLAERVENVSQGAVGEVTVVTPPLSFELRLAQARTYVAHRCVLAGDAAHTVHPLAGQGVNLGFRDAQALAGMLAALPPSADCGDAALLRRYARQRRADALGVVAVTDGLQRLFSSRVPGLNSVRNLGLTAVNTLPGVRRALAMRALA